MMMSVPHLKPALKTTVLTHVILIPAAEVPFAKLQTTYQYADAQKIGLAIRTKSALNVSFSFIFPRFLPIASNNYFPFPHSGLSK